MKEIIIRLQKKNRLTFGDGIIFGAVLGAIAIMAWGKMPW